jgi:F-type H+-transporting ATPase subunit delta
MAMSPKTIEHYADALIAIGNAANALRAIEDDFVHLLDFMEESEALQRFLASATVSQTGKRRSLQEILNEQIHPLLIEFLIMLLTAGDVAHLKAVAHCFFEKASQVHETISGEIHVAVPLSDDRVSSIETEVGRLLNKRVTLRPRVLPGILGGALIKVGNFIVDGTIDRQLEEAKRQLLA